MSFEDDIQGQNTQLFPVVEIDGVWYSTNNVTVGENYCKPILMNIPSIKESVDVESRKFKISNVNLQFNNFPFDGVRFSDQLSETSLINTEATIYFKSPSTNTVDDLEEVYKGIIRRISHDDEKVKIELEDLTEKLAHKDLPEDYLGSGNEIPSKYRGKLISMVYGHVDRSPCVFDGKDIIIDSNLTSSIAPNELIDTNVGNSLSSASLDTLPPLFISDGEQYSYILETPREDLGTLDISENFSQIAMLPQWHAAVSNNKIQLYQHPLIRANVLQCVNISTPSMQLSQCAEGEALPDNLFEGFGVDFDLTSSGTAVISAAFGFTPPQDSGSFNPSLRFKLALGTSPQTDFVNKKTIYVSLNGLLLPASGSGEFYIITGDLEITEVTLAPGWGHLGFAEANEPSLNIHEVGLGGGGLEAHLLGYPQYDGSAYAYLNEPTGDIDFETSTEFSLVSGNAITWLVGPTSTPLLTFYDHTGINSSDAATQNDQYVIDIHHHYYGGFDPPVGDGLDVADSLSMTGAIDSASFKTLVDIEFGNKDFFAGVNGRENTFDNHPELLDEVFIENPIDIIYDLVRSELGHDAIDEAEYAEAKNAHLDWKFGFTVNKKINSKKLIEDIAKSTKCFPKFKNDGTFGFNTIKDNYSVDAEFSDYNMATLIKESEVISYSFKKTKPEQIWTKVDVKYHKDYAQDSYLKSSIIGGGNNLYYGITAENVREFNSDYIRNSGTAAKLAKFLYYQHKNDHLLFNLKLPLQYINLEIGDLVKFRDLFNGVKAYGVDYRIMQKPNLQWYFPLFIITSTQKNLDSVSIECMQLHLISGTAHYTWFDGIPDEETEEVNTEGLFYFPDADPIVISDVDVTPFVITPPEIWSMTENIPLDASEGAMNTIWAWNEEGTSVDIKLPPALALDGTQATWPDNNLSSLVQINVLGETYANPYSGLGNPDVWIGPFSMDTQVVIIYSVTSPTSGLTTTIPMIISIDVNNPPILDIFIKDTAPPENFEPHEGATFEFTHILQLEDVEGVNYAEKYVYNTSPDQQIQYSASDLNDPDGDLTNSVVFGYLGNFNSVLEGNAPDIDLYADAQWAFNTFGVDEWASDIIAIVQDSIGFYTWKKWSVLIQGIEPIHGLAPTLLGDTNLDGTLNILDVVNTVNYVLGNITLEEQGIANADFNQSGIVDVLDIVQIINQIMDNG